MLGTTDRAAQSLNPVVTAHETGLRSSPVWSRFEPL